MKKKGKNASKEKEKKKNERIKKMHLNDCKRVF